MIISDVYKYVFVELPRTGSTAIATELCKNYSGAHILYKHATYDEFFRIASPEQRSYFVFSGIRNPLDDAVSLYFKLRTDHEGNLNRKRGFYTRLFYAFRSRQSRFINRKDADFSQYFLRYYNWPYDNWSTLSHKSFDYVIRFEDLQRGFTEVLRMIGAEQERPLPARNRTAERNLQYHDYYTPKAKARAQWVFAVYMEKWNYPFPWCQIKPGTLNRAVFCGLNFFRVFYWRRLRRMIYTQFQRERRARRKVLRNAVTKPEPKSH